MSERSIKAENLRLKRENAELRRKITELEKHKPVQLYGCGHAQLYGNGERDSQVRPTKPSPKRSGV